MLLKNTKNNFQKFGEQLFILDLKVIIFIGFVKKKSANNLIKNDIKFGYIMAVPCTGIILYIHKYHNTFILAVYNIILEFREPIKNVLLKIRIVDLFINSCSYTGTQLYK